MRTIPNNAPTNVAAIDERDPNAGNASHEYGIQYGGPSDVLRIGFQHGPRGIKGSTAGIFDDDLLAIVADRMAGFQSGPFTVPRERGVSRSDQCGAGSPRRPSRPSDRTGRTRRERDPQVVSTDGTDTNA